MAQIQGFRTAGNTGEQVVCDGPCKVHGVRPELTTTGTISLRNTKTAAAGTVVSLSAIGLTQAGKDFNGMVFDTGLTVQLSVASDLSTLIFERIP